MDGYTAIDAMYLESVDDPNTPAVNEDEFTWDSGHYFNTHDRISSGIFWWYEIANLLGIQPQFTYIFRSTPPWDTRNQVPFEPIRRNAYPQDFDWISRVTAARGVTAGNDSRTRARNYGAALRAEYGAKNGFPVFVTYNPDNAPGRYLDLQTAYAWYGDYVNILYRNGDPPPNGYPVEQTGWVFAHEMGHVFWACDEYASYCGVNYPNCANCYFPAGQGPRPGLLNLNCDDASCNPAAVACIMRAINSNVWINHTTCVHTRNQIGWPD